MLNYFSEYISLGGRGISIQFSAEHSSGVLPPGCSRWWVSMEGHSQHRTESS